MSRSPPSCSTHASGTPVIGGSTCSVADDAQPPRPLAHEQCAVGQELDAPGRIQPVGEHLGAECVAFALDARRQGQRRWRQRAETRAFLRLPDVNHHGADLQVGQRGAERLHGRARHAIADDAGDVGIGVAVLPLRVDKARSLAALERGAVTIRAERPVHRGDAGRWRRRAGAAATRAQSHRGRHRGRARTGRGAWADARF